MKKNVSFSNIVKEYITYSYKEYDRSMIDHVIYRKAYGRVTKEELDNIFTRLDLYKLYDMKVHIDSLKNNSYHTKNVFYE